MSSPEDSVFRAYWKTYGGVGALVKSGFLWAAVALAILTWPVWIARGWWDIPLSVIPNLMGFSLGGLAIFLSVGDPTFHALWAARDPGKEDPSPLEEVTAAFMHFVVVQVAALVGAIVLKGYASITVTPPPGWHIVLVVLQLTGWFVGFLLFLYSLTACLAVVASVFRLARSYSSYLDLDVGDSEQGKDES